MHKSLIHHPLRRLIHAIGSLPEAERFDALSAACLRHDGALIPPGTASQMFEISLLGVSARATGPRELVQTWLGAALTVWCGDRRAVIAGGRDDGHAAGRFRSQPGNAPSAADIDHHPDHRAIQLAAAQATLSEIDRRSDAEVAQACRVILALSRDHVDRTRAQDLLLVLKGV